ncbi:MAG: hypothetical protein LAQ69_34290 [Acidobacteriia bacterium]|nr:hypothetical protein [Terriglobia bacterium]
MKSKKSLTPPPAVSQMKTNRTMSFWLRRPVQWLVVAVAWVNLVIGWAGLLLVPVVFLLTMAISHPRASGLLVAIYTLICLAHLPRLPVLLKRAALAVEWLGAASILLLFLGGLELATALLELTLNHKALTGCLVTSYVLTFLAVQAAKDSSSSDERLKAVQAAKDARVLDEIECLGKWFEARAKDEG